MTNSTLAHSYLVKAEAQRAIDDARLSVDVATIVVAPVDRAAGPDTAAPPDTTDAT